MKKIVAFALCLVLTLAMCAAPAAADNAYRTLYSGEFTTLNYLTTATTNEFAMAANVIDTLVEYDKYGQVQPSLAESWEYDEANLTYTFKIREGAKWVKADGSVYADVTAHDFVTAAKYILDAANASSTANIFYSVIAGAEDYYLGTSVPEEGQEPYPVMDFETVGVKALDDYTLQYTLVEPVPYFLSMVTYVCFMPVNADFLAEKGADFGVATSNENILYNGAYILSTFEPQQKRVYTKNATNWDADKVLIETIEQTYNKESATISPELYKRGDIDDASIDSTIAAEWLSDEATADLIHPVRQSGFYTYFYAFNFDPQFDAAYEPENWKIAVNNANFRKSIYYGLDRVKAMLITDPDNPEAIMFNTVTPPEFVSIDGLDYTQMGALAPITELGVDTFNEAEALALKEKAVEELTAAGATFPIKVLMSYNPNTTGWAEECVVVEQQLETLFGADYIDIIIEAGPSSGFLKEVRRSGKYALLKCNWGPDYADPNTYTDPFYDGTYNWPEKATEYLDENGVSEYYKLVDAAREITNDLTARYEAYTEAEAFLINNALIIPFGYGNGGYTASRLNPFESQFAPFGISNERYKGQTLLEKPMNTDEYFEAYDKWEEERAALAGE
ncbi:MAG: peptide ABC transporter substrate-binding protein [Clostridia bacterium]|nr:peptide ABC transporter substrate-binding protein [Clostridia bacterium]MBQ6859940.1 peptide ABC transporter substrate-binding protein [Clostridia bacterium]MBQ7053033.1 peptide ABC transporter substrate-binding protein [Clostridia bacterium]